MYTPTRILDFVQQRGHSILVRRLDLILLKKKKNLVTSGLHQKTRAQSAGSVEYTKCIPVHGYDSPNACPGYDTKKSDGEAPVNLKLWGIQSTPWMPSLHDPFWSGVEAPDRVLSMDQIKLKCNYAKLNCLKWAVFLNNSDEIKKTN